MVRPRPTTCLDCSRPLGDAPVYCMECGTPAHRDCFDEKGFCAKPDCTGLRYRETPRGKGVNLIAAKPKGPDAGAARVPRNYSVDFTSLRESLSLALGIVVLVIGFFLVLHIGSKRTGKTNFPDYVAWVACAVGAATLGFRAGISDYRVFDGRERAIWLYRQTFGYTHRTRLASFDVCRSVTLVGRRASRRVGSKHNKRTVYGREWLVVMDIQRGRGIELTDTRFIEDGCFRGGPPGDLQAIASSISRLVGVEVREQAP